MEKTKKVKVLDVMSRTVTTKVEGVTEGNRQAALKKSLNNYSVNDISVNLELYEGTGTIDKFKVMINVKNSESYHLGDLPQEIGDRIWSEYVSQRVLPPEIKINANFNTVIVRKYGDKAYGALINIEIPYYVHVWK